MHINESFLTESTQFHAYSDSVQSAEEYHASFNGELFARLFTFLIRYQAIHNSSFQYFKKLL